ncbi:MAG: response regulator transcription factor [Oscillospiraceae bacterium]|nr:response regulator transcription factor [Oscillospiraceae bacterium]
MEGRILVIEDDIEICSVLTELLSRNNYDIDTANDGETASFKIKKQSYDLVLTDLMLPHKTGEQLIKELRSFSDTPVVVISAKSLMETRLEVLRLGADDYILKPFDLNEVLVRIQVVLRRSRPAAKNVLSCEGLEFDLNTNSVEFEGKSISLTSKEMHLLRLLMEYPSKVFTKANLYESVWNEQYFYEDNTINVHVSNLRSKLKKATGKDYIETVWGIGYRLKGGKD